MSGKASKSSPKITASETMRQISKLLSTDQSLCDMFPQLAKLTVIGALIPVSTAKCEGAFSAMNHIKAELRNQLKTSVTDQHLLSERFLKGD